MIVNTSALIEIVRDQPEARRCFMSLLSASSVRISAANLFEAHLVVDSSGSVGELAKLRQLLHLIAVTIEPVTASQVGLAQEANRRFGRRHHPAKLNYGDCFAYALAKETGEPLLFVGNDFGQTDIGVA